MRYKTKKPEKMEATEMATEDFVTDIIRIPVGWSGYLIGTKVYDIYKESLESMGVYRRPDGYDGVSLFWVEGKNKGDLERRMEQVYEFVMNRV